MLDFIRRKQEAKEQFKSDYQCTHKNQILTKFTCSNGVIQYVMQCTGCKNRTGGPIAYRKLTQTQRDNAPEFDYAGRDQYWKAVSYRAQIINERFDSAAWWEAYNRYLESPEWKAKRSKVLNRDHWRCTMRRNGCTLLATEVHHLTYKNVGDEPLEDLTSICHDCHEQITAESRGLTWIEM